MIFCPGRKTDAYMLLLAQEYRCLNKNGAFYYQLARIKLEITFKTKLETETGKNLYILTSLILVCSPGLPGCLPNRATNTGNLSRIMAVGSRNNNIYDSVCLTCSCCEQSRPPPRSPVRLPVI